MMDVLVQVHIPKCAGTSVSAWLRRASEQGTLSGFGAFYNDFVFDDDSFWQAGLHDPWLTAISAHTVRRFPPTIGGRRMHYFTILRHPWAHFFSLVRYMIQEREAYRLPASVGNSTRAVAGWLLERPSYSDFRENTQTNHLALYPWCDMSGGRCDPTRTSEWDAADRAAYERERLDVAKASLRSFIAVGTVERLGETLDVLRRRSAEVGLHLLPVAEVPRDNVTRVPLDDIAWIDNDELGRRVRDSLAVDWELYQFAQQLVDEARSDAEDEIREASG